MFMNRLQFLDASLHFWSSQSENVMPVSVLDRQLCSCVCTNRCSGRRKGTLREGLSDKYSVFRTTGDQQSHVRRSSTTVSMMLFGANFRSINSLKHKNYTMIITMIMIRNYANVHTMFNFYLNSHNKKTYLYQVIYFAYTSKFNIELWANNVELNYSTDVNYSYIRNK